MMAKIDVNGPNAHPVYKYLRSNATELRDGDKFKEIQWNFGKFIVGADGKVISYHDPAQSPNDILPNIKKALGLL